GASSSDNWTIQAPPCSISAIGGIGPLAKPRSVTSRDCPAPRGWSWKTAASFGQVGVLACAACSGAAGMVGGTNDPGSTGAGCSSAPYPNAPGMDASNVEAAVGGRCASSSVLLGAPALQSVSVLAGIVVGSCTGWVAAPVASTAW